MATSASNLNLNKIQKNPFVANGQGNKVNAQDKEAQALKSGSVWNAAKDSTNASNANNDKDFAKTGNMKDLFGAEFGNTTKTNSTKSEYGLGKIDGSFNEYEKQVASQGEPPSASLQANVDKIDRSNYKGGIADAEEATANRLEATIENNNQSGNRGDNVKKVQNGQVKNAQNMHKKADAMEVDQAQQNANGAAVKQTAEKGAGAAQPQTSSSQGADTMEGGQVIQIAQEKQNEQKAQGGQEEPDVDYNELAGQEAQGVAQYNQGNAQAQQLDMQAEGSFAKADGLDKEANFFGVQKQNSETESNEAKTKAADAKAEADTAAQAIAQQTATIAAAKAGQVAAKKLEQTGEQQVQGGKQTQEAGKQSENAGNSQKDTGEGVKAKGEALAASSNPGTAAAGAAMIAAGVASISAAIGAIATAIGLQSAGAAEEATGESTKVTAKGQETKEKGKEKEATAEKANQEGIQDNALNEETTQNGISQEADTKANQFGQQESATSQNAASTRAEGTNAQAGSSEASANANAGKGTAETAVAQAESGQGASGGGSWGEKAISSITDNKVLAANIGLNALGTATGNNAFNTLGSGLSLAGGLANGNLLQAGMGAMSLASSLNTQDADSSVAYSGGQTKSRQVSFSDSDNSIRTNTSNFFKYSLGRSTGSSL